VTAALAARRGQDRNLDDGSQEHPVLQVGGRGIHLPGGRPPVGRLAEHARGLLFDAVGRDTFTSIAMDRARRATES